LPVTLVNLQLHYGPRAILRGVDLNIRDGECLAIVGPNGCGKSTLLRVIAGIERPDAGEVNIPHGHTIGYLPQEADLHVEHSLSEELLDAFREVRAAQDEMRELETQMAALDPQVDDYDRILNRYADCVHLVEHHDAYSFDAQVARVAAGLGFSNRDLNRSCSEFSGGWRMRILLAKLLLRGPDVMLLDEPTNHLDLETTLWLESWIRSCGRTVVMVSHERATMDRLAQRIVCIGQGRAEVYPGDYTNYLRVSAEKRDAQWDAFERQKKEIDAMEGFIRRFRATASRAALVQSRIRQLDKIERLEPPFHPTAIHFQFPKAPPSYREVVTLENVGQRYGKQQVFSDLDLTLYRGQKIALVGVNGAGKSTLLRILAGTEDPTEGQRQFGERVRLGYFAQYDTSSLSSDESLLQSIEAGAPTGQAGRARDVLGAFLFSGDDVAKPLRVLSGGERTRFRLAQMLFSPANLLLLDEPTNHLDITSRATVEEALQAYTGTVVIVSHDRVFMDRVTDRILEIDQGRLREYPGTYSDYIHQKENQVQEEDASPSALADANSPAASNDPSRAKAGRQRDREERKALSRRQRGIKREIEEIENRIAKIETRLGVVESDMGQPEISADFNRLSPLLEEQRQLRTENESRLAQWTNLHEELDQTEAQLERA